MLDVQSQIPKHQTAIDQVGISDFLIPIKIVAENKIINTNAKFSFSGSLKSTERGTHMSRLILILHMFQNDIFNYETLVKISREAKEKIGTKCSILRLDFDYFINKKSPVTKFENIVNYKASIWVRNNCSTKIFTEITAPVTAVCPCSKEISNNGAHNQRGEITITAEVTKKENILLTELIKIAESAGSSEVYSILKREDEKYVTEKAYQNAMFVEDMVREVDKNLKKIKIENYIIKCKNYESIHNHNAFAEIRKGEICI